MPISDQSLYKTPFSRAYWHSAMMDFKRIRLMIFAALMIAACIALSYVRPIYFDLTDLYSAKLTWGFLARSVCSMVCGPVMGLAFGFAEDTISFFVNPQGPYFPGYALTTMLGNLIYALFLYRAKFGPVRVALAKFFTNLLNVFLGSLWSAILGGKGYWVYVTKNAITNAIKLPAQVVILCVLFAALTPILRRMGWIPAGGGWGFRWKKGE